MKKLICLVIVIACAISLLACGDTPSNARDEITPSGQEMQLEQIRTTLSEHKNKYLQSDLKEYQQRDGQWFEFVVSHTKSGPNRDAFLTESLTAEGRFGFINGRELVLQASFLIEQKATPNDINSEMAEEKNVCKYNVVFIDGVTYIDIEDTYYKGDSFQDSERRKIMSDDPLYASDLTEALNEFVMKPGSDWDYYGFGIFDLFDYLEERREDSTALEFYLDGNFIYSDVAIKTDDFRGELVGNFLSRIKLKNESAIVERFTFEYEYAIKAKYGDDLSINSYFDMKQIAFAVIKAPNVNEYVEL